MINLIKINITLLLILVSIFSFGNISGDKKPHKDDQKGKQPEQNVSMLIEAKRAEINGDLEKAELLFKSYTEKYPEDPVGYFEFAQLLGSRRETQSAEKTIREAVRLDPENVWYQLYLAEITQVNGNLRESEKIYAQLVEKYPEKLDYYYQLAAIQLMEENYDDAIETYNKVENLIGITEEISMQKEKIYLQINDLNGAEKELEKLLSAYPENSKLMSVLAEFYLATNKQDKALEMYKKISATNPGDPYIYLSMADYYRKTGDKEKAFENLKLGFANPNLSLDTKMNVMLTFFTVKDLYENQNDKAFELVKILVKTHPDDPKSHSIYGDLLSQNKQFAEAREEFMKAIELDSSKYVIWEEVLRLDIATDNYTDLAFHSQKVISLFPEQPLPYLFSGLASFQQKDYNTAITSLTRGSKMVVNDTEMEAQFYMYLGDAYHSLKNEQESDKYYQKSLDLKGDNAYVLNNYAYYLSVRNQDLTKAESMAKKAITIDPENSSFQDTYGWVLFKLGKYEEAKTWISRALNDKEGPSSEVLEHYGDVLFMTGNADEALVYWKKAKEKGDGSEFLDKKISQKKIIE